MGRKYGIACQNIEGDAVADTGTTILSAFTADTAGHRFRLRELTIGFSDDAPADLNAGFALKISDNAGAGTKANSITPEPFDSNSLASLAFGGSDYTAEPTDYGDAIWTIELHRQSSAVIKWDPEDAPVVNQNELIGLLNYPRTAAAASITASMTIEEF